jgi:hypothetical protein
MRHIAVATETPSAMPIISPVLNFLLDEGVVAGSEGLLAWCEVLLVLLVNGTDVVVEVVIVVMGGAELVTDRPGISKR